MDGAGPGNFTSSSVPPPIPPRPSAEAQPANWYFGGQQSLPPPYMGCGTFGNGGGLYNYYQPSWSAGGSQPVMTHPNPTDFLRKAEESSRNAFQSVESVVGAFVSVANMLNSTHAAVFNTFRAVAGVVEQFRTLKHFMISTILLSILRWLRFIWRHCLAQLRIRPRNYANSEVIWSSIQTGDGVSDQRSPTNGRVNWAALLFWLVALGGPFLLYKCIGQIAQNVDEARKWARGEGEHYTAQALYDFNTANQGELSFSAFDVIRVAPKSEQPNVKDWLLASKIDGSKIGLVPINYIRLLGKSSGIVPANP